tara:strand:+ start:101 stop:523 length:423 start_codon:yes stop_codon:yes gene_type:complete
MGRVFFNVRKNVHSLTADYQALASDSGKDFFLDAAAGLTLTLPAISDAQEGWHCRVTVSTVTTSNNYIITEKTASDTDKIVSHMAILEIDTSDDGLHSAAHTTITFEGTPAKGDYVEIICDGTFYYAKGLGVSDDFVAVA